jgi:DNA-binding transcriptional LysR family regulator
MVLDLMRKYPMVELVQHAGDSNVDIVADRYDFAIRAHSGALPDSTLVQRPLAECPWHLFAAPDYLDATGWPETPEDLKGRPSLFMKRDNSRRCGGFGGRGIAVKSRRSVSVRE